jgi:glycosyltransferase involved in cell wall biosynthesis
MVSVHMITYNHEEYIAQAIDGVLMQKADFRYELVIGEDCSTDSTRDICEKYANRNPEIIRLLPSESNLGMMQNAFRTTEACNGKYIALCEGDDYWTDIDKLQKQVDFMEENPEYSLTFGNAEILDLTGGYHKSGLYIKETEARTYLPSEIITLGLPTLTMVFRNYLDIPDWFARVKSGDLFLRLLLSLKGKFYYHGEVFGVHRKHHLGISRTSNKLDWYIANVEGLSEFHKICLPEQKKRVNDRIVFYYCYAFYYCLKFTKSKLSLKIFRKLILSSGFYTLKGMATFRRLFIEVIIKKNIHKLDIF